MVKPFLFQIVGFQNSGKTTLVKKLLKKLKDNEINTVTIKHHGHGGTPQLDDKKDSAQHVASGSIASIVEGDGRLILHAEKEDWSLEEKIKLLSFFKPEVILIEGHKFERYEKAVIVRNYDDIELLKNLNNIRVIFYWNEEILQNLVIGKSFFHIDDPSGLNWIVQYIKNQL